MIVLIRMFIEFALIGLVAIGGGLATIPYLANLAERTGWFSASELADMIAVSESTPGPIGINLASFVGFKQGGIPGVLFATFGIVFPSVVVIVLIAKFMSRYRKLKLVNGAISTLRPAACAMIAAVLVSLVISVVFPSGFREPVSIAGIALVAALAYPVMKTKLHPIIFLAIGAAAGIIFKM